MRFPLIRRLLAWIIVAGALGFVSWVNVQRAQQVTAVSQVDAEAAVLDPASPTGYAEGKRWLIVPERNNASYQWIAETQHMLARGENRIRRIDYENAPLGREVHSSSLYHFWLGLVARADHAISARPLGLSVERAALWADPILQLLLILGTAIFAARYFGVVIAALLSIGLATFYPLASTFLPGLPDDHGLAQACALWSILPLLAGVCRRTATSEDSPRSVARWFFIGGAVGGVGLWNNVAHQLPILAGIMLGGLFAAFLLPRCATPAPAATAKPAFDSILLGLPWRTWALGGAVVCLLAYLIDYFPSQLPLHLEVNHPLHGMAWLGAGELLALFSAYRIAGGSTWTRGNMIRCVVAVILLAALPVATIVTHTGSLFMGDPQSIRLTYLPDGSLAKNLAAWMVDDGLTLPLLATVLPMLLLIPPAWLIFLRNTSTLHRISLSIALGPVLISFAAGCAYLRWWNTFDVTLLALLSVCAAAFSALPALARRFAWVAGASAVTCGVFALMPPRREDEGAVFTKSEVQGLIERALAHWLADRAEPNGVTVLCPPEQTPSLTYYGGLLGLGTANWENREGVAATVRIVSATTSDEAHALLADRGVTHLVFPSWDTELNAFVRWTLSRPEDSFLHAVQKWALPTWLRPVPYPFPKVAGFEDQSVAIFKVTENADRATSLSWIAEAALELQQPQLASAASEALQVFPANLSALVSRALVEKSQDDGPNFAQLLGAIESALKAGLDRRLPWERRVGLAVILAQGQRPELARKQVERCLAEADEARLKALTTGSLFRLQVLAKAFALHWKDEHLHQLARALVPPELRERL